MARAIVPYEPVHEKTNNLVLTRSDANRAVQSQMFRDWKFWISKLEELYYP